MSEWTKNYTNIDEVNNGNQYKEGDHITTDTLNVPLNNSEYAVQKALQLEQSKVDKETNKKLIYNYQKSDADFNDFTSSGFYYLTINLTNSPQTDISSAASSYYHLCVVTSDISQECLQIASNPRENRIFTRYHNTDGWGSWNELQNKETDKYLIHNDSNNNTYDLNDLKTTGMYYCNTQSTNLPPNPNNGYFRVIVNGWQNDSNIGLSQIAQNVDINETYVRTYADGTWSSWEKLVSSEELYKSYYNLGAYDTFVDNGDGTATITRQTGYRVYDGNHDVEAWSAITGYRYRLERLNDSVSISNDVISLKANINTTNATVNWGNVDTLGIAIDSGKDVGLMLPEYNSNSNVDGVKKWLSANPIHIQYKTSASYIEQVILDQPLLDLPQQGTQWLREEWEKGCNYLNVNDLIFESGNNVLSSGFTNNNGTITISYASGASDPYVWTKAITLDAGTYTLSYSGTNDQYILVRTDEDYFTSARKVSFTLNERQTIQMRFDGEEGTAATFSNIMLVKGNHALPYQPYNGNLIRENDIIDSLDSTETKQPLSANQGRVLNEKITSIETDVTANKKSLANKLYFVEQNDFVTYSDKIYTIYSASNYSSYKSKIALIHIDIFQNGSSKSWSTTVSEQLMTYMVDYYPIYIKSNVDDSYMRLYYSSTNGLYIDVSVQNGTVPASNALIKVMVTIIRK